MRETKRDQWARLISEQEVSGKGVHLFCRERVIGEKALYWWRRRLRKEHGVRFALVETRSTPPGGSETPALELIFINGERLRIGRDVGSPRCARCWMRFAHDSSSCQRAGLSVPDAVRYAQKL
jgi:hypothetical protein